MARASVPTEDAAPAVSPDTNVTLTFAQLKELLGSRADGITPDVLGQIMTNASESMRKALKPENTFHPGKSFSSYPEGEQAKPKKPLPFELLWRGYPVSKEPEASTWWEWDAYATLKPGTYTVSRRDGAPLTVTVAATFGADGTTVDRLIVEHANDREMRALIAPPFVMCYQMQHADRPRAQTFVEGMTKLLTHEYEHGLVLAS